MILEIAKTHSKSPAQIILRWDIQRGICAIPKSVSKSRIEENINIFDFKLSDEEMNKINGLNRNVFLNLILIFIYSQESSMECIIFMMKLLLLSYGSNFNIYMICYCCLSIQEKKNILYSLFLIFFILCNEVSLSNNQTQQWS